MSLTCRHVVFDTETTGFRNARVIEVAAIEFNPETGETGERFHYYVNPAPQRVEPAARRVHGLDNRFLARHPAFSHVATPLQTFLGDAALYAHNAPYDRRMLDLEFGLLQLPPVETVAKRIVCTLAESYKRLPGPQRAQARPPLRSLWHRPQRARAARRLGRLRAADPGDRPAAAGEAAAALCATPGSAGPVAHSGPAAASTRLVRRRAMVRR